MKDYIFIMYFMCILHIFQKKKKIYIYITRFLYILKHRTCDIILISLGLFEITSETT